MAGDGRRQLQGIFVGQQRRGDLAHQTGLLRPLRINTFTAQHHPAGQRFPYAADQTLGASGAGHNTESDFRQAEARVIARHHQVAEQRQLAARAKGVAVDSGDQRLRKSINPRPQTWANIIHRGRQVFFRHFVQVGAGGKETAVAADHAGTDIRVRRRRVQGVGNLRQQRVIQGISRLRAIEGQQQDPLVTGYQQIAHAIPLASKSTTTSPLVGSAWQLRTYPAASSSASRL
ncbi:Uncharacterised protein [Raoultella ornithinolytica]|nr:Uncharacterised protein [Raoultella ornithinolytica]